MLKEMAISLNMLKTVFQSKQLIKKIHKKTSSKFLWKRKVCLGGEGGQ